jgi:hypothetical protein
MQYYEMGIQKGNGDASFYYALARHYGTGFCDDLDIATDCYTFAMLRTQSPLTGNAFRCRRALKKGRFPRVAAPKACLEAASASTRSKKKIPSHVLASVEQFRKDPIEATGERILGTGGQSQVTLEIDPKTRKLIAVKHIWGTSHYDALMREVRSLVELRHPCIVRILGWCPGKKPNEGEIHLEYAPNGPLSKHLSEYQVTRIRPGFWDSTRMGIVICDIVLGMRYVHSRRILHRDLKPSNILLSRNFRGMISDFGVSRPQYVEGPATGDTGTPLYAAPEQLDQDRPHTTKTDVFAFGLVLFEIIGNRPVFPEGTGLMQVARRLRAHDLPTIPAMFGPFMQDLIPRCWLERPEARPSFQGIFDEFRSAEFNILPEVDCSKIKQAVGEVLAWEANSDATGR